MVVFYLALVLRSNRQQHTITMSFALSSFYERAASIASFCIADDDPTRASALCNKTMALLSPSNAELQI
jgi:hypothetical protein